MAASHAPQRQRQPPKARSQGDDAWVDQVTEEVQALLREHGLDFELLVMLDPITETLHAVGYDGAAARYFRSLETDRVPSEPPAPRGTPMENIQNPAVNSLPTPSLPA